MSEPDRAGADGRHPAEDAGPCSDTASAGLRGWTADERDGSAEQGAGGGGPAETSDGPEPGDSYVPV
jgi:hypothetical protein